jgi:hypothetical protein
MSIADSIYGSEAPSAPVGYSSGDSVFSGDSGAPKVAISGKLGKVQEIVFTQFPTAASKVTLGATIVLLVCFVLAYIYGFGGSVPDTVETMLDTHPALTLGYLAQLGMGKLKCQMAGTTPSDCQECFAPDEKKATCHSLTCHNDGSFVEVGFPTTATDICSCQEECIAHPDATAFQFNDDGWCGCLKMGSGNFDAALADG